MSDAQIESISLCDAQLWGIAWEEDGRDLVLQIHAADKGSTVWHPWAVTCRWAEALDIRIVTRPGQGGYPLSFDGEITSQPDGKHSLMIDFGGQGELRLVCSELDVSRLRAS